MLWPGLDHLSTLSGSGGSPQRKTQERGSARMSTRCPVLPRGSSWHGTKLLSVQGSLPGRSWELPNGCWLRLPGLVPSSRAETSYRVQMLALTPAPSSWLSFPSLLVL